MDIERLYKGMPLESEFGVSRVLVVDKEMQSVLVESQHSEEQSALNSEDIAEEPQLHQGCDQYY
ncbi:hypothetical protein [Vibrio renipiscarius]|uniref:Malate dehydrogenase n=1 Tax=Vibrio renipiscarius TaxID=1461322 RepID=A0A0C2P4B4_9VIBR|nr:hypothetical protein [Vibrio renipiscarius]KII77550.1 malate dehydrogenase [Vibrio renipiscarius]KII81282.1 malate dehydrogenase [Vibrio renipiscarius]